MCRLNCQGHAYNSFPKMGDNWIPDDIFSMEPLMRNFFENTSTVQVLLHTCLLKKNICLIKLETRKITMRREQGVGPGNALKNLRKF